MRRFSAIFLPVVAPVATTSREFHQRFQQPDAPQPGSGNQTNFVGRVLESWPEKSIGTETQASLILREMPDDVQEGVSQFGGFFNFCKLNANFFGVKMVNGKAVVYLNELSAGILAQKKFKEGQREETRLRKERQGIVVKPKSRKVKSGPPVGGFGGFSAAPRGPPPGGPPPNRGGFGGPPRGGGGFGGPPQGGPPGGFGGPPQGGPPGGFGGPRGGGGFGGPPNRGGFGG